MSRAAPIALIAALLALGACDTGTGARDDAEIDPAVTDQGATDVEPYPGTTDPAAPVTTEPSVAQEPMEVDPTATGEQETTEFAALDLNGDGSIDETEAAADPSIQFDEADADSDGELTEEEWREATQGQ